MTLLEQNFNIPTHALVNTNTANKGGNEAFLSVFRVICPDTGSQGSGFIHKSGLLITAEHVIRGSQSPKIFLNDGTHINSSLLAKNIEIDIALLKPESPIKEKTFEISDTNDYYFGTMVSTWGFPAGYNPSSGQKIWPLLSVGYLSGLNSITSPTGQNIPKFWINAAFNPGNSGGPLIHLETGKVIGVVSSRLTPTLEKYLAKLNVLYNKKPDSQHHFLGESGNIQNISEGQIFASILKELCNDIQLVIGLSTTTEQLKDFLSSNKISA